MISKILKTIDLIITNIEEWVLFILMISALSSLFVNVVLRYGFNYTLAWSEELVRIVIIYSTFIGASMAIKKRSMIRIDAIVQIFPKLKSKLMLYSDFMMLIFGCLIVFFGYKITHLQMTTNQKTIIMQIPLVYIYSIMPFTGTMIIIRTIQTMVQDYLNKKKDK